MQDKTRYVTEVVVKVNGREVHRGRPPMGPGTVAVVPFPLFSLERVGDLCPAESIAAARDLNRDEGRTVCCYWGWWTVEGRAAASDSNHGIESLTCLGFRYSRVGVPERESQRLPTSEMNVSDSDGCDLGPYGKANGRNAPSVEPMKTHPFCWVVPGPDAPRSRCTQWCSPLQDRQNRAHRPHQAHRPCRPHHRLPRDRRGPLGQVRPLLRACSRQRR